MIQEEIKSHDKQISKVYPIAEIFTSIQGEGVWTGQMQTFIRLAGCTVGKPYPKQAYDGNLRAEYEKNGEKYKVYNGPNRGLPIYTEKCTLFDGRTFACDTDYRVHKKLASEEIIEQVPSGVDHVCITGGEPMMHDLSTLITHLHGIGRKVHIETSGTILHHLAEDIWVTVSPKHGVRKGMIERADEIKVLVDKNFDPEVPMEIHPSHELIYLPTLACGKIVYLQPINGEYDVSVENLDLCMQLQRKYPAFRVSIQLHKVLSHYLKEVVR